MIKDYWVHIPPHLADVLADLGNTTSDDFDTIISAGRPVLFNFTYPVPSEDKEYLENFICNRFILRRIGSGNVKKWRQLFKWKMLEIMPYYGKLLESEHLEFDPLINNDIETTDNSAGTLDTTRDKTTVTNGEYEKSGDHSGQYSKNGTYDGEYAKNGSENGEYEKAGTAAGTYSKQGSENANNTELNRYSDTPQGDSSRVWETDAQGHVRLTDYYITDVRGITTNGTRSWNESGQDSKNTTDAGNDERSYSESGTDGHDTTDTGTDSYEYSEAGSDERTTTEHEVIDTDTTHTNDNVRLGVAGSSKSKLLSEFRDTFLRIYSDIAEELEPLFYNLVEVDDMIDFV